MIYWCYFAELEREKIISKLLLGHPRDGTGLSTGGRSLYYRPVANGGNERVCNVMCMKNHAPNNDINISNESIVANERIGLNCDPEVDESFKSPLNEVCAAPDMTRECHNNGVECNLIRDPEVNDNVKYSLNEVGARIANIRVAPDMTLECHDYDV